MESQFFLNQLYPLQDQVLAVLQTVDTGLYLTGGTALSRGYLNHRYSDDLDFFADDKSDFLLWVDRAIETLSRRTDWHLQILSRDDRFVRAVIEVPAVVLRLEFVNDVPSRVGIPWMHPVLGRLDTAENILANKVTAALDRSEPKDLADIWGLSCQKGLSLTDAINGAQGKAAGVFPADLGRVLCSATRSDWEVIRWVTKPDPDLFVTQLHSLGESLLFL